MPDNVYINTIVPSTNWSHVDNRVTILNGGIAQSVDILNKAHVAVNSGTRITPSGAAFPWGVGNIVA